MTMEWERRHAISKIQKLRLGLVALSSLALLSTTHEIKAATEQQQEQSSCTSTESPEDSIAVCSKALYIPNLDDTSRIKALVARARAYISSQRPSLAIDDLEASQKIKYIPGVAYLLSQLYINIGREQDAISELSKMVDAGTADANVFSARGAAYQNAGDFDASISDFSKELLLNPKSVMALNNRSAAYAKKGDYADAVKDLDTALAINPNLSTALANRCLMLVRDGRPDEGFRSCAKAEHLDPDNPINLSAIGYAHYVVGHYDIALKYFNRAASLQPESPYIFYMRGSAKAKTGDREGSDADLTEAARLKPDIAAAMNRSGWK